MSVVPAFAQSPIPIRVASPAADDDPIGIAAMQFSERVQELIGDEIVVRVFSRSTLGSESAALEATIAGNIDVDIVSNSVLRGVVPELAVLDIPFGLTSLDHAWRVLDGEIGETLSQHMKSKGLRLAGWAYAGSRCLMTRTEPVKTPDDMQGMKFRVPDNPTYANIVKAWGAIPTTINWRETYLALSQGVVDGIETAPGPSFDQKHYEVAKYLIRTDHLIYFHLWVISEKAWKSWPANVQTAVFEAAKEAALQNHKLRIDQDRRIYDEFASKGVRILEPDRAAFAARLIDVQDSVNSELQPLLQRIRAVQ